MKHLGDISMMESKRSTKVMLILGSPLKNFSFGANSLFRVFELTLRGMGNFPSSANEKYC